MPRTLRWLLLAIVLTALPVTTGVLVIDEEAPAVPPVQPPAYSGTDLTDYDTSVVALTRAPFCDRIPEDAFTEALRGDVGWTVSSYDNGQSAAMTPTLKDVAHEYGCRVGGAGLADGELRAWLFAPPVPRSRATELVAEAGSRAGCTRQSQAPAYGAPSIALICPSGDRRFASFRGLFGDAWLACSLGAPATVTDEVLLERAGRWCVAVAKAAAAAAG